MKEEKLIDEGLLLNEDGFLSDKLETDKIINEYDDYFSLGAKVNKYAYFLYEGISASTTDKIDCYFCQAFAKAHKDFQACILLAERGMRDQSEVLIRVLLENLFVATAIYKNNDKYIEWEQAQKHETNKALSKVKKGELSSLEEYKEQYANVEGYSDAKQKFIKKWAEEAEMIGEYEIDYAILSNRIHPSSSTFIDSFCFTDGHPAILYTGPQIEDIDITLLSATSYFLRFCVIILKYFLDGEKIPEEIELQYDELEKRFRDVENKL